MMRVRYLLNWRLAAGVSLLVVTPLLAGSAGWEWPVIPAMEERPVIDGVLTDACWRTSLRLADFTQPGTTQAPLQSVEAYLGYDLDGIYVGIICAERDPRRIVALRTEENDNVWQDDCVEIWVRSAEDSTEYDQFVVNAKGVRETIHNRRSASGDAPAAWTVRTRIGRDRWTAELSIPFPELGRASAPVAGQQLFVKIGREDYDVAEPEATFAIWPPGEQYGRRGDYGRLYFSRAGFLDNPRFRTGADGAPAGWEWAGEAGATLPRLQLREEDGETVTVVPTPDGYSAFSQTIRLLPNRMFVLRCETRGTAGGYLRARTNHEQQPSVLAALVPSDSWEPAEVLFTTGRSGKCTVVLGSSTDDRAGILQIRGLSLEEVVSRRFAGPAIPVEPRMSEPFVVSHVPVTDCRVLRGFCGAPVDGTTASWDWADNFWEYNMPGTGTGVQYGYRRNDGLHVFLADRKGVNAIQVRGGVYAMVATDCARYDDPSSGRELARFPGKCEASLAYFHDAVRSDRFSFFDVKDGVIADVGFFRVTNALPGLARQSLKISDTPISFAAKDFLADRFRDNEGEQYTVRTNVTPAVDVLELPTLTPAHLITSKFLSETGLGAVGLWGTLEADSFPMLLTVQVQDPVHPFSALTTVTVSFEKPGDVNLVVDIPDHVLLKGSQLWVTLIAEGDAALLNPAFDLYTLDVARAKTEALAFQKLKLKGFFSVMSEARPWNVLYYRTEVNRDWRMRYSRSWPHLKPLVEGMEYCLAIAPQDSLVKQYQTWFFRRADEKARIKVLKEPVLPPMNGAPEWAVVARTAWLESRRVPEWWITNRVVPTGEFGTEVNDDSCMYQNLANYPMFEQAGVGADVKRHARNFYDHATGAGGNLEEGINARQDDPLHAYEEGINHESMMAWWHYGDPVFMEQCMIAARSVEALTMTNDAGHRHFRGMLVSAADLRNEREPEEDGYNHAQLMHPVLEVARYNRNPRATELLTGYAQSWLEHSRTPGQYASRVETATDRVTAASDEPFTEGMGCQVSVMLAAAEVTGNPEFVKPLVDFWSRGTMGEYSVQYIADLYHRGYLAGIGDALESLYPEAKAMQWSHTGDKRPIIEDLRMEIAELQTFRDMYTSAEFFADRVFLSHDRRLTASAIAYTGGFATRNKPYHSHAVSWAGFGTEYAALVRRAGRESFEALLYNFRDEPMSGTARFWTLEHGQYVLTSGVDGDHDDTIDSANETRRVEIVRGEPLALTLSPRAVTVLSLRLEEALQPLDERADLALSPLELRVEGDSLAGVAHNIGAADAEDVDVALLDAEGVLRQRVPLGTIRAPLDLSPRRMEFTLVGIPPEHAGWRVVLDPENRIPEITEINNSVAVP